MLDLSNKWCDLRNNNRLITAARQNYREVQGVAYLLDPFVSTIGGSQCNRMSKQHKEDGSAVFSL